MGAAYQSQGVEAVASGHGPFLTTPPIGIQCKSPQRPDAVPTNRGRKPIEPVLFTA